MNKKITLFSTSRPPETAFVSTSQSTWKFSVTDLPPSYEVERPIETIHLNDKDYHFSREDECISIDTVKCAFLGI